jgi:hypothetical protein
MKETVRYIGNLLGDILVQYLFQYFNKITRRLLIWKLLNTISRVS